MSVITFLATATMENFALVPIRECANVENVFVTQNGIVQVFSIEISEYQIYSQMYNKATKTSQCYLFNF